MQKVKSIKNGDLVKGVVYCRKFDFNRDSWKGLVNKLISKQWNKENSKYLPVIKKKLKERISKSLCTESEVKVYMNTLIKKQFERKCKSLSISINN